VIAHVGVIPVEELLPLATGAGAAVALARGWIIRRVLNRREPGT